MRRSDWSATRNWWRPKSRLPILSGNLVCANGTRRHRRNLLPPMGLPANSESVEAAERRVAGSPEDSPGILDTGGNRCRPSGSISLWRCCPNSVRTAKVSPSPWECWFGVSFTAPGDRIAAHPASNHRIPVPPDLVSGMRKGNTGTTPARSGWRLWAEPGRTDRLPDCCLPDAAPGGSRVAGTRLGHPSQFGKCPKQLGGDG